MINQKPNKEQGIISIIIIVIIGLIFLHYKYNFDILAFFKSAPLQSFLATLKNAIVDLYNQLVAVIKYILDKIK